MGSEFKIDKIIHKNVSSEMTEFKTQLTNAGITDDVNSVFDSADTNKSGDSKDVLDISEQFAFAKGQKDKIDKATYDNKTHERKQAGISVHLDEVWGEDKATRPIGKKITDKTDGYGDVADISKYPNAEKVLDKILELKGFTVSDSTKKEQLQKDFIKYNISMFKSDNTVLLDADWSKLDFPTDDKLKSVYGATKADGKDDDNDGDDDSSEVTGVSKEEAKADGVQVAKDLIGYTTEAEQVNVEDTINTHITKDNIVSFIDGYNSNKSGGDSIAEQIMTEYGWNSTTQVKLVCKIFSDLVKRALACKAITSSNEYTEWNKNLEGYLTGNRAEAYAKQTDIKINSLTSLIKAKEGTSSS